MSKSIVDLSKPCHELFYCPYGVLVEQFPLYELETKKAIELGYYVKFEDGKGWIPCTKETEEARPDIGKVFEELGDLDTNSCSVFGHTCPIFYVSETYVDETKDEQPHEIPKETMDRVMKKLYYIGNKMHNQ